MNLQNATISDFPHSYANDPQNAEDAPCESGDSPTLEMCRECGAFQCGERITDD